MKPQALTRLTSPTLVLSQVNIDTDQIIPARFLTTTSMTGLGVHAFADWRFDAEGRPTDCELNRPLARQCRILVAGANFGCGSSREHAPWALVDFGFRVVISSRIADIFRNNAPHCGLLPIEVDAVDHAWLLTHPGEEVTVDLVEQYLEFAGGHRVRFEIEPFARRCLLQGSSALDYLLEHAPEADPQQAHEA